MYTRHPAFLAPKNPNSLLWRYIDFTKLISLLDTKCLFFCRADRLQGIDAFEGTFPRKEFLHLQKQTGLTPENIKSAFQSHSKETFINCWHLNDSESMAMWKIYSRSESGIAIQTTFDCLSKSFANFSESVYIGLVQYVDFPTDTFYAGNEEGFPWQNTFVPFIHKRAIFKEEHEVRAIYTRFKSEAVNGVKIPVELNVLVQRIVLSPNSPAWYEEVVRNAVQRALPGVEVVRSSSDTEPYS